MLDLLGADAGPCLLAADSEVNPKGFWEHREILEIHEQLFAALGMTWDDARTLPDGWWLSPAVDAFRQQLLEVLKRDFSASPLWLLKDPRTCRLLPLWRPLLSDFSSSPLYILTLRDPSEVAQSLQRRDQIWPEWSCLLWLIHTLDAEYMTRGETRAFVRYDDVVDDWPGVVDALGESLALDWPVDPAAARDLIAEHVSPDLRRSKRETRSPDHLVCQLANRAYQLLSSAPENSDELDELRAQALELSALVSPWSMRVTRLRRKEIDLENAVARLQAENEGLSAEIARLKATRSWRNTAPFRAAWNLSRQLFTQK